MEHYFTNNDNLRSKLKTINFRIGDITIPFVSDLGVFSKDKIDYGSRLLISAYLKEGKENITLLDVGCGYGVIGITLARLKNVSADMVDINRRAIHLAKMNIKANKVAGNAWESNIYDEVQKEYDVIITNPPIRAGKQVVLKILKEASNHLKEDGELWFVIRKDQGAKSIMKLLSSQYNLTVLEKSKGFLVILAKTY